MRVAIVSDIQGNLSALRAILHDVDRQDSIDETISLGNAIGLGPHPNEVLDLLKERGIESVLGNYEDAIVFSRLSSGTDFPDEASERVDRAAVEWTRRELNPAHLKYVENLPQNVRLIGTSRHMTLKRNQPDERLSEARRGMFLGTMFSSRAARARTPTRTILALHGSPRALNESIREDTANSILTHLGELARADIVISGHARRPFLREHAGVTYVGVGAASGLEARPGETEYAVLTVGDDVSLERRAVTYDHRDHVRSIREFGLPPTLATRFDPSGR